METRFIVFFRLLFLREHVLHFTQAVLVCYLNFITYRRANAFGTQWLVRWCI